MNNIRYSFILTIVLSLCSIAGSQTLHKIATTTSNCKWVGTIHSSGTFLGTESIDGTVIFTFSRNTALGIEYTLTGGHLTWVASGTAGDCSVSGGPLEFDVSPDSGDTGSLIVYTDGGYAGSGIIAKLDTSIKREALACPGITDSIPAFVYDFLVGARDSSSVIVDESLTGSVDSYTWDLHLEGVGTKLSVESVPQVDQVTYDNWLPTAKKDETTPGSILTFHAELLEADNSTACARADSFKFELINVSHEKGVALNYPEASKAKDDFDLHFDNQFIGANDILSADKLTVVTEKGRDAVAVLHSYDWGAYGSLKVSAYMHHGNVLIGYLKGHPEITEITIPKRSNNSKIADKWKNDRSVAALSDDDDDEIKPFGDGNSGDGFTLYEEYRGFYEKGKHIFGDPKQKDLFVYTALSEFIPGIQMFQALTKIKVHYRLFRSEFDVNKRIMNFNHTDAPHQSFDQHGLWLKKHPTRSFTRLGPPRNSDSVNIAAGAYAPSTFMQGRRKEITDELSSTVAHELGHAVRIPHHGEDIDQRMNSYTQQQLIDPVSGTVTIVTSENNVRFVDPRWENDNEYTEPVTGINYIGVWGGEHSGVEDCIMRYDVAFGNIPGPGTASNIRYITDGNERTGITLCNQSAGTGVNAPTRTVNGHLRVRYGPATNGFCKSQIRVNDKP